MNLKAIARRFNAARDRRKALRCIDTQSDAGSWAEALDPFGHCLRPALSSLRDRAALRLARSGFYR